MFDDLRSIFNKDLQSEFPYSHEICKDFSINKEQYDYIKKEAKAVLNKNNSKPFE